MSKRLEFSRKTRAAIIERAGGYCESCKAALKPGESEIDHRLPCALGGEPTVANGRLLCKVCHKAKTASDVRSIRKADRVRDKSTGAKRPKRMIQSRGFEKKERKPKPGLPPRPIFKQIGE